LFASGLVTGVAFGASIPNRTLSPLMRTRVIVIPGPIWIFSPSFLLSTNIVESFQFPFRPFNPHRKIDSVIHGLSPQVDKALFKVYKVLSFPKNPIGLRLFQLSLQSIPFSF
jgi:hypothetical protein